MIFIFDIIPKYDELIYDYKAYNLDYMRYNTKIVKKLKCYIFSIYLTYILTLT